MSEKEHINPAWISKSQMVRSAKVNVRTFERWEIPAAGYVGRTPYYTIEDLIKVREGNQKKKGTVEKSDIEYQKYRLLKEQADAQELKNEQAREELASVEMMVFVLSKIAAQTSSILDGLPLNYFRKHPDLTVKQQESLKLEIAKTMNVIANISDSLDDILNEYFEQTKENT